MNALPPSYQKKEEIKAKEEVRKKQSKEKERK
jgi:hypothetical protein